MCRSTRLSLENLERREVFSATPGLEMHAASPALFADRIESGSTASVTDKEIIDALNNGTQLTSRSTQGHGNGIVDAADYVVWRKSLKAASIDAAFGESHDPDSHFMTRAGAMGTMTVGKPKG